MTLRGEKGCVRRAAREKRPHTPRVVAQVRYDATGGRSLYQLGGKGVQWMRASRFIHMRFVAVPNQYTPALQSC